MHRVFVVSIPRASPFSSQPPPTILPLPIMRGYARLVAYPPLTLPNVSRGRTRSAGPRAEAAVAVVLGSGPGARVECGDRRLRALLLSAAFRVISFRSSPLRVSFARKATPFIAPSLRAREGRGIAEIRTRRGLRVLLLRPQGL